MGRLVNWKSAALFAAFMIVVSGCSAFLTRPASGGDPLVRQLDLSQPGLLPIADPASGLTETGGITAGRVQVLSVLDLSAVTGATGLSGLRVSADGSRLTAVSDLGYSVSGRLEHDASGTLTGLSGVSLRDLPVPANSKGRHTDAEELERLPDGGWLVSYERVHRILRYANDNGHPAGQPSSLVVPDQMADAPRNSGVEAMALLSDGRLVLLEEGEDDGVVARRGWIGSPDASRPADWQALSYIAAPYYRAVAATPTPDGGMIVLERQFSLLAGWGSRLVRVPPEQLVVQGGANVVQASIIQAGIVLKGEELLRLERPFLNDNFEGVAVRPAPDGGLFVYMVVDDNRSPFQRPYLMQLLIAARQSVAG